MTANRFAVFMVFVLAAFSAGSAYGQDSRSRTLAMPSGVSAGSTSLSNSVESGTASAQSIPLTLIDAIHRGLKSNLAAISGGNDSRIAEAARLRDLSELRPKVSAEISAAQEQLNLAAFGFTGFPGIRDIIGPFGLVDARAKLSQPLIDMERVHDLREARENEKAVSSNNDNTRELVVLTVLDLYFRAVSAASRVQAVEAQVTGATALNTRAIDLKNAGVVPGIDALRAQVELQTEQQRLIQARNDFSRQKLSLARAIGMPLGQEFTLVDMLPGGTAPSESLQELLSRAYANRSDAKSADSRIRAAEEAVKAAQSESLPTARLNADYGAIGPSPSNSHGTFTIAGSVQFPIFNSKAKNDTIEKEALLHQRRAEADSLHGRIELDVRSALLDLQSAEEQYKVAQSSLELVRRQLDQAQDRFTAGVANNLEVVQAQQALALGDENVIESLYAFNASRALLAHAMGVAEISAEELFGGNRKP